MVVGCGESQPPEPTTAKAPDIPIHKAVGTGDPDGALIQAAKDGNIEAAKQAINDGADVNAKADWGGTPLCDAAYRGHKEIVELLIAEGADLEAMDIFEDTPLDQAIKKNTPKPPISFANTAVRRMKN